MELKTKPVYNYFDDIVLKATEKAKSLSSKFVYLEFVLWAFLKDAKVKKFLEEQNINYKDMYQETKTFIETFPMIEHTESSDDNIELAEHVKILKAYYIVCTKCNQDFINDNTGDILCITNMIASFLFMRETFAQNILLSYGINQYFLSNVYNKHSNDTMTEKIAASIIGENEGLNAIGDTSKVETALQQYTTNLTEKVKSDDWIKIIGREKELDLLQQVLLRHDKPNAIIVGNDGIGKTKLVEGLARIYLEKHPEYTFYQLDTLSLISNLLLKGELENRIKNLSIALKNKKSAVLFIDEMQTICGNSDFSSQGDIISLLKPLLNDGQLRIVGTTTFEDYRKYIEKDTAFTRKFFRLTLEEPTKEETKNILMNVKSVYEKIFDITITEEIIDLIIDTSTKYFANKCFPDKAIDMIDTLGAFAKFQNEHTITDQMVYKTLSMLLNIPLSNVSQSEEEIYQHLEDDIKKEIMGQDEAVEKVADAVIISRSGLRETNKTASSMMFMGESGVGKTEICRVLSKIMNIPLVRFDMSEYMEEHSVSKLLGAPPGYKGFGDGKSGNGLLINAIDEHPNCILLLDEIEKANSKIHNILLQVMDNGKITSSSGKSVSFEHVFLIMTSNVGSYNTHKRRIGFGSDDSSPADDDYKERFLPEFRNRIDATIKFNSLPTAIMKNICNKFLTELQTTLSEKNIEFSWNDDIIKYIVDKVDKSGNGARPMKHIITNEIKNKIAKDIVFGKFKNGGKIDLSIENEKIVFGGIDED